MAGGSLFVWLPVLLALVLGTNFAAAQLCNAPGFTACGTYDSTTSNSFACCHTQGNLEKCCTIPTRLAPGELPHVTCQSPRNVCGTTCFDSSVDCCIGAIVSRKCGSQCCSGSQRCIGGACRTPNCGSNFCSSDQACCAGNCCAPGKTCCNGACVDPSTLCGGQCCGRGGSCCAGSCCASGHTCCSGVCMADSQLCNRQCCTARNVCQAHPCRDGERCVPKAVSGPPFFERTCQDVCFNDDGSYKGDANKENCYPFRQSDGTWAAEFQSPCRRYVDSANRLLERNPCLPTGFSGAGACREVERTAEEMATRVVRHTLTEALVKYTAQCFACPSLQAVADRNGPGCIERNACKSQPRCHESEGLGQCTALGPDLFSCLCNDDASLNPPKPSHAVLDAHGRAIDCAPGAPTPTDPPSNACETMCDASKCWVVQPCPRLRL